jgi:Tol biopolymer transport system component
MPQYSPDGKKIVFVSCRSGTTELWLCGADGSQPYRLTSFGGPLVGMPNWSPDGQWIVFHARPRGQADLFVIPAAGGPPKPLTADVADDAAASYSHDGRWIYFGSRRSGDWQIWKLPAAGGSPIQLTETGGWRRSIESPDGRWIYFYRLGDDAMWRVPTEGGAEERVTAPVQDWPVGFAITRDGIYYPAPPTAHGERYIRFFSVATRQDRAISAISRPVRLGFTVSPDGRHILFDQIDRSGSDLMLIRDFQP